MADELFTPGQRGMPGVPGEQYPKGSGNEQPQIRSEMEPDEFGQVPATEEEQAQYEQFVVKAMQFIADSAPQLIQQMNNPEVPVYQLVGRTALQIVDMISDTASAAGMDLDFDLVGAAGEEVVEMLMEVGDAAEIWPFKTDSDEYDEAMAMSLAHGYELAAKRDIERGDEAVQSAHQDRLAMNIAREQEQGRGPGDDFFATLEHEKAEIPRRQIHGVK